MIGLLPASIDRATCLPEPAMTQAATPNAAAGATESPELSKSFEPAELESRWYAEWEKRGYFTAGQHVKRGRKPRPM